MAQGLKKNIGGKKKSAAAVKKQEKQKVTKGRKTVGAKGRKADYAKQIMETSKNIAKKNELAASAKAVASGHTFFLNDIKEYGKKELEKQNRQRNKTETKSTDLTKRLKDQLRKLGKET
jgi:hypothetical protein